MAQQGLECGSQPEGNRYRLFRRVVCGGAAELSVKSICRVHMCEALASATQKSGPGQRERANSIIARIQIEGMLLGKRMEAFAEACRVECSQAREWLDNDDGVPPWKRAFLCAYRVGCRVEDGFSAPASWELRRLLSGVGKLHEWIRRQAHKKKEDDVAVAAKACPAL